MPRFIDGSPRYVLSRSGFSPLNSKVIPVRRGVNMRIFKLCAAALLGVSAVALSGCDTGLNTEVTRYQAMPAPQGQTFVVVPGEGMAASGGLEFQRYASIVAQQLAARGYTPATSPQGASMIVQLGYGVDHGQMRYV